MLFFRQEEQKENPQLGQPYSLVNRENPFVHLVQDMLVSYTIKQYVLFSEIWEDTLVTQRGLKCKFD